MQRIQIQTMILGAKAPRMQHATTRLAVGIRRIKTSAAMPGERVISWDVPDANHREDEGVQDMQRRAIDTELECDQGGRSTGIMV